MPPIHLWVYNHSFYGIGDQVSFAVMALRQHGYQVSVGQQPRYSSLNVVIEGFSSQSRDILLEFCQSTRKRVAMIMTEHIDAEHGQILVHGAPLGSENDYMHPATILARIKHLLECVPYLRCFVVLRDDSSEQKSFYPRPVDTITLSTRMPSLSAEKVRGGR